MPQKEGSHFIWESLCIVGQFFLSFVSDDNIFLKKGMLGSTTSVNSDYRLWRWLFNQRKRRQRNSAGISSFSWVCVTITLVHRPFAYDSLSLIFIKSFDASYFSRNYSLSSNYWYKVIYNIILQYFNVLRFSQRYLRFCS